MPIDPKIQEVLTLAETYEIELPVREEVDLAALGNVRQFIDHTLLKPEAIPVQIEKLCAEAREYEFKSVCINPIYVPLAAKHLKGSKVLVCTVVGFPLGAVPAATKAFEAKKAVLEGAQEIDMVISVGMLKGARYEAVLEDILGVVQTAHANGAIVKVIIETALLTRHEKILASLFTQLTGAEFVKTSTGFAASGATVEDVELMRAVVGPAEAMGVKAAGGVRSLADAYAMLKAGATRLGTSAGVKIMQEYLAEKG